MPSNWTAPPPQISFPLPPAYHAEETDSCFGGDAQARRVAADRKARGGSHTRPLAPSLQQLNSNQPAQNSETSTTSTSILESRLAIPPLTPSPRAPNTRKQVLLTRVGEFYETYGVDAVMLMQHAGLNQMGQEVRAGCPRKNLQQTLNGLTSAGLTVAVYEEVLSKCIGLRML